MSETVEFFETLNFNDKVKIKFSVIIVNSLRLLEMEILDMDERFRGKDRYHPTTGGLYISSYHCPDIASSEIFLRGKNKSLDNDKSRTIYSLDFYNRVKDSLTDWSINWEGWGQSFSTDSCDSCNKDSCEEEDRLEIKRLREENEELKKENIQLKELVRYLDSNHDSGKLDIYK